MTSFLVSFSKHQENNRSIAHPITIEGYIIEEVTEFPYLGANVTKESNSEYEVKARISKATGSKEHVEDQYDQQQNNNSSVQE